MDTIIIYLCVFILNYERQITARILFGNSSSIYIKNRPKYVIGSATVYIDHENTKTGKGFGAIKYQKHQIIRTWNVSLKSLKLN